MDNKEKTEDNKPPVPARRTDVLCPVSSNDDYHAKRRYLEKKLKSYTGDDPLKIWLDYISLVEQHCLTGGKDLSVVELSKKCLLELKDIYIYKNDARMLLLWLKYADGHPDPLAVFNFMSSKGFCCELAHFYIEWACRHEAAMNFQSAYDVLHNGINVGAEPVELLHRALRKLDAKSVKPDNSQELAKAAAAVTEEGDDAQIPQGKKPLAAAAESHAQIPQGKKPLAAATEESHAQIPQGKKPLAAAAIEESHAQIPQGKKPLAAATEESHAQIPQEKKPLAPVSHCDDNVQESRSLACAHEKDQTQLPSKIVPPRIFYSGVNKENVKNQDKRTDFKGSKLIPPQSPDTHAASHCEENQGSEAIAIKDASYIPPIALFEEPDPYKRPMYDKVKVYRNGTELSFEEIHAALWYNKELRKAYSLALEEQLNTATKELERLCAISEEFDGKREEKIKQQPEYVFKGPQAKKSVSDPPSKLPISTTKRARLASSKSEQVPSARVGIAQDMNRQPFEIYYDTTEDMSSYLRSNIGNVLDDQKVHDIENIKPAACQNKNRSSSALKEKKLQLYPSDPAVNVGSPPSSSASSTEKERADSEPDEQRCFIQGDYTIVPPPDTAHFMLDAFTSSTPRPTALPSTASAPCPTAQRSTASCSKDTSFLSSSFPKEDNSFQNPHVSGAASEGDEMQNNEVTKDFSFPGLRVSNVTAKTYGLYRMDQLSTISEVQTSTSASSSSSDIGSSISLRGPLPEVSGLQQSIKIPLTVAECGNLFESKEAKKSSVGTAGSDKGTAQPVAGETSGVIQLSSSSSSSSRDLVPSYVSLKNKPHSTTSLDPAVKTPVDVPFSAAGPSSRSTYVHSKPNESPLAIIEVILSDSDDSNDSSQPVAGETSGVIQLSSSSSSSSRDLVPSYVSLKNKPHSTTSLDPAVKTPVDVPFSAAGPSSRSTYVHSKPNESPLAIIEVILSDSDDSNDSSQFFEARSSIGRTAEPLETQAVSTVDEVIAIDTASSGSSSSEVFEVAPMDAFNTGDMLNCLMNTKQPVTEWGNCYTSTRPMRRVTLFDCIAFGDETYIVTQYLGRGSFAMVFKAILEAPCSSSDESPRKKVALKVGKTELDWEFYICAELHTRLENSEGIDVNLEIQSSRIQMYGDRDSIQNINLNKESQSLMKASKILAFPNGRIVMTDLCQRGTLVDLINAYTSEQESIPEPIVMFLTFQILSIISKIHQLGVIHGDLKSDNFLVTEIPSSEEAIDNLWNKTQCVRVIDFGRSIDLKLFRPKTAFVTTCTMFEGTRDCHNTPFLYEIDWFGVAGTIHTLLFTQYMKPLRNEDGFIMPLLKFKRYWYTEELWEPLFERLLNMNLEDGELDVVPYLEVISNKLTAKDLNQPLCRLKQLLRI